MSLSSAWDRAKNFVKDAANIPAELNLLAMRMELRRMEQAIDDHHPLSDDDLAYYMQVVDQERAESKRLGFKSWTESATGNQATTTWAAAPATGAPAVA